MDIPTYKTNTSFLQHMRLFYKLVSKQGYLNITSRYRVPVITRTGLSVSGYICHHLHFTYDDLQVEKYHHDLLNNLLFDSLDEDARAQAVDAGLVPHGEIVRDVNHQQIGIRDQYFHNFVRNLWVLFDQPRKFYVYEAEYIQLIEETVADIHRLFV